MGIARLRPRDTIPERMPDRMRAKAMVRKEGIVNVKAEVG